MNPYYPVLVNLAGKRCLVVGNGFGAEEKVRGLEKAGAVVTWKRERYESGDVDGFFLVISAAEDRGDNVCIQEEAERRGILFNAVDDPAHCNFILPAIHRQGDLIVAVSTSGRSPAVASRLRDRFAKQLGPEWGRFVHLLGELRQEIAAMYPEFEERKRIWYELVDSEALRLIREGDEDGAARVLRMTLERSGSAGGGA